MISREELTRIATRNGFPLQVMEKDYALTWALKAIYSNPRLFNYLVFKGGTCLSKVYAEKYRLSEDLDFSTYDVAKLSNEELKQELTKAFTVANQIGAPNLEILEKDMVENPGMINLQIRYIGPLNQPDKLKIDISLREYILFEAKQHISKETKYSDIEPFTIHCYDLIEILLEKLRAIIQRGKTRDYYDVWQIMTRTDLRKQAPFDLFRIRLNLEEKYRYGDDVSYEPERMFDEDQLDITSKMWKDGLGRLVKEKELPSFDDVISDLKRIFWAEAELAGLNKDLHSEHIRNLKRDEASRPILIRSVELLVQRLDSTKASEVENALSILWSIYADETLKIQPYRFGAKEKIEKLTRDKDHFIQRKAKELLDLLKTNKSD